MRRFSRSASTLCSGLCVLRLHVSILRFSVSFTCSPMPLVSLPSFHVATVFLQLIICLPVGKRTLRPGCFHSNRVVASAQAHRECLCVLLSRNRFSPSDCTRLRELFWCVLPLFIATVLFFCSRASALASCVFSSRNPFFFFGLTLSRPFYAFFPLTQRSFLRFNAFRGALAFFVCV